MAMSDYHVVGDPSLAQSPSGQTTIVIQTPDKANQLSYNNTSSGLNGTNVQSAIDEVDGRIDALSNNGAKNLLPMTLEGIKSANTSGTWSGNAYTYNGVTFTVNTDSNGNVTGIATSGTSSAQTVLNIFKGDFSKYIGDLLSGSIGGDENSYRLRLDLQQNPWTTYITQYSDSVEVPNTVVSSDCMLFIEVRTSGIDMTNKTFYPMIRLATDTDSTFQPYAKTNLELTDDVRDIDYRLEGNACANLLPITLANLKTYNTTGTWSGNAYTHNGVTFTVNTDSNGSVTSITVSGTATANTNLALNIRSCININTQYTLSGCPSGGTATTYRQYVYDLHAFSKNDNGDGVTFTYNGDYLSDMVWRIVVYSGYAIPSGGLTFYPMISRNPNATYEPHYPSNKELANTRPELKSKSVTVSLNSYGFGSLNTRNIIPLFVYDETELHNYNFYNYENGIIGTTVTNVSNNELIRSTNVSGTLYYYEL